MAWYSALLPCMLWWRNLLWRNSTNRYRQSTDDLTSLTDKIPNLGERTTPTDNIDGKSFVAHTVVQTRRIGDREHQSTTAGKINHKALRDPELFAIRSSCIDKSASKWMVSLYYEPPPSLDDLEIKNFGSRIPESEDDPIEAIFHYEGENIWVSVPYLYARTRSLSSGLF
ncbi:uncharacterized protein BO96DRAFT_324832 [Aspergillus niger CBS 101883]|uniref:Uncharacterized protein n=1 Tax=Aspergillus niger ATCC 13496 TaxID=1353008 RepID=A0A370BKZ8_ASPNG|nr:hypothetical protein ANI_1_2600074 [Aspergillus niger CBS 513.88]XP_025459807.1 uncharacterized protein BO96DRAFT_324832 [Aspergillus niger CBS 101883]PYH61752.1 hypothetical protein BO96DRAFT_324832 [Aspergillus niger CBS 101883]RDH14189.1 hypothetical protein M747DRAFT_326956 [Aspergillus niger ATCC 13496]|eukprot:XP_001393301.2 hypothetical protein ANI_1_2600074 [Aspergillus niger CBS 513.88]